MVVVSVVWVSMRLTGKCDLGHRRRGRGGEQGGGWSGSALHVVQDRGAWRVAKVRHPTSLEYGLGATPIHGDRQRLPPLASPTVHNPVTASQIRLSFPPLVAAFPGLLQVLLLQVLLFRVALVMPRAVLTTRLFMPEAGIAMLVQITVLLRARTVVVPRVRLLGSRVIVLP